MILYIEVYKSYGQGRKLGYCSSDFKMINVYREERCGIRIRIYNCGF